MALTKISTDGVKDDAVTAGKIPANAVGSSELADNAVDTNAIANNAVTSAKIAAGNVTATELATNSVEGGKLTDSAITNAKVHPSAAIEGTKIAPDFGSQNIVTTGSITGNDLEIDSGTLSVDASNNRVGIGTTSPSTILHTKTSGGEGLRLQGTATSNFLRFTDASDNGTGFIGHDTVFSIVNQSNTDMRFNTNNTERMRINSSGNVGIGEIPPADNRVRITSPHQYNIVAKSSNGNGSYHNFTGVSSGGSITSYITHNGRVGAADGIIFGSDTAAANILDDYEEGTFSPKIRTIGSSQGEKIGTGRYTKIGNKVTIQVQFDDKNCSGLQDGNYIQVTNLPFTANSYPCTSTVPQAYNIAWNGDRVQSFVTANNTTTLEGYESRSGGSWQYWASGNFRSSQIYLRFNLTYFTDS